MGSDNVHQQQPEKTCYLLATIGKHGCFLATPKVQVPFRCFTLKVQVPQ